MKNYDNLIWYAWNYDYKFIEKCWNEDKSLANHLRDKFNYFVSNDRRNGFFTFVGELDSANREKLYAYIDKTFSKEKGHLV